MCSLEEAFPKTDSNEPPKRRGKKRALLPPPEDPDRVGFKALSPPERLTGSTPSSSEASWTDFAAAPDPDYFHPDSYLLQAPEWVNSYLPDKTSEPPAATPQPWFDSAPTLWQNIPTDWKGGEPRDAGSHQYHHMDDLQHRLDSLFARLDAVEHSRTESNHTEVILFVLGGLFLLFMLDLLVKQGTQVSLAVGSSSTFFNSFKGGRRNR